MNYIPKGEVRRIKEEEKEYLKTILKFGNYKSGTNNGVVKYIVKNGYYLELHFSPFHSNSIYIDKNLFFKGLNENEKYTLKDLELFKENK